MQRSEFEDFFSGMARRHLQRAIRDSLMEDGPDLTSNAVFHRESVMRASIIAKEESLFAGLYIAAMTLDEASRVEPGEWGMQAHAGEGDLLAPGEVAISLEGGARLLLRAERVILNFITHLSGIANLTRKYVQALEGTGVRLLDTRKTLPGLRYPEKYAVLVGGGCNHRLNLTDMLMLKDNHIDAAGGISKAVDMVRKAYDPTPPIEVECRTQEEVREAVNSRVSRIMLDNMYETGGAGLMRKSLDLVPPDIEVEISGGVTLENIGEIARACGDRKADFISVGRLTHSAPAADFSMRVAS